MKGANAAKRNKVVEKIGERRVDAQVYYPTPIHKMPFYRRKYGKIRLPITETTARQVFSLPVHPGLSKREITEEHLEFQEKKLRPDREFWRGIMREWEPDCLK